MIVQPSKFFMRGFARRKKYQKLITQMRLRAPPKNEKEREPIVHANERRTVFFLGN